ncbi:MAG: HupE/UreJ family protein [Winogradskyella sp.]|uniref:HupE/UreJ family protein n=1 Tax=Winogradskyella sp. TaxID=1883156 RepID=UPI0017A64145|nr:HupE/UreJ family protein [Winogradskyella sp.]
MLDNFWFNVQIGINHILDVNGYDHILFLIVLAVPYVFNSWKRILILVSLFTIGHSISLFLGVYDVVKVNSNLIEFLIPVTILIAAVYNVFTAGKKDKGNNIGLLFITTLFFGLIHGLGFAREAKMIDDGSLAFLLEFALGIEIAQLIVVFVVLFLGFLCQTIFRFSRRDWVMVLSAVVIGLVIPMIIHNDLLK